jgi:hypothetical protein
MQRILIIILTLLTSPVLATEVQLTCVTERAYQNRENKVIPKEEQSQWDYAVAFDDKEKTVTDISMYFDDCEEHIENMVTETEIEFRCKLSRIWDGAWVSLSIDRRLGSFILIYKNDSGKLSEMDSNQSGYCYKSAKKF